MSRREWNSTAPTPPPYPENIAIQSSACMSEANGRHRIVNPAPVLIPPLGPKRCNIQCPFCNIRVTTSISHTTTNRTHLSALMCSGLLCCCCIPYMMTSTRNTDHYCSSCHAFLGTYKK